MESPGCCKAECPRTIGHACKETVPARVSQGTPHARLPHPRLPSWPGSCYLGRSGSLPRCGEYAEPWTIVALETSEPVRPTQPTRLDASPANAPDVPLVASRQPSLRVQRGAFDALARRALDVALRALQAEGVQAAPAKGIVLSRWLYEDVTERPYIDVDLLLPSSSFARAERAIRAQGWPILYRAPELGELVCVVSQVEVELHAYVGRRYLSRLTVDEVLARARIDRETFPFEILHLDDVDHFLLLVANVVKDGFVYANLHQPQDLERMLVRIQPRLDEVVERARAGAFLTAIHTTAAWMRDAQGSAGFAALAQRLPPTHRPLFAAAIRLERRRRRRAGPRLRTASGLVNLALAVLTPDDRALRLRGLAHLVRAAVGRRPRAALLGGDAG